MPPLYYRAVRPHSRWVRWGTWSAALRAGLVLAGGAVVVRAAAARLPGLNPPTLWHDDLVFGSIIRSERFLDMVTVPVHVAPGLLVVWRWMYTLFPDPEWSLQLLPYVCGVVAIPLTALVAWRLTGDAAVTLLAGAVTSLVELLAHDDDPVMFSATGVYLAAFYGPWPITTQPTSANSQGTAVTVARDRTLYLPRSDRDGTLATEFLHRFRSSDRVWYLGHQLRSDRVVTAMKNAGYAVETIRASTDYRLFRGRR